ncbi:hypothetical protein B0H12DRAFT_1218916 [Mycena haematopus]|nr:hypothetical protein B0H12DRAFT_1218916 [Mycena haematopus]
MKSSTTFFLGLSSGAMAAVLSSDPAVPVSVLSTSASGIPSISASSSLPPITTAPTPTGGYVVTGVYTTCLTLTFENAVATFSDSVSASSAPGVTYLTGTDVGVVPTLSLSGTPISVSSAESSATTNIAPPDEEVFTTCLAFLATPSVSFTDPVTSTFATGSASAAEPSATASASASAVTLD